MDQVAFSDSEVISILNKEYYAVKMNAESTDTIVFEGKRFMNLQVGKRRRPTHEISLLLASRKNRPFSLPANIILDKNFRVKQRKFEYLSTKKLLETLK